MSYLERIKFSTNPISTNKSAQDLINEWFDINKHLDEIPRQSLLDSLKKSEDEESISFASGKDALKYLDDMIANDKRTR